MTKKEQIADIIHALHDAHIDCGIAISQICALVPENDLKYDHNDLINILLSNAITRLSVPPIPTFYALEEFKANYI